MLLGQAQPANAGSCLQKEPKADAQGRIKGWGKQTEKLPKDFLSSSKSLQCQDFPGQSDSPYLVTINSFPFPKARVFVPLLPINL